MNFYTNIQFNISRIYNWTVLSSGLEVVGKICHVRCQQKVKDLSVK